MSKKQRWNWKRMQHTYPSINSSEVSKTHVSSGISSQANAKDDRASYFNVNYTQLRWTKNASESRKNARKIITIAGRETNRGKIYRNIFMTYAVVVWFGMCASACFFSLSYILVQCSFTFLSISLFLFLFHFFFAYCSMLLMIFHVPWCSTYTPYINNTYNSLYRSFGVFTRAIM